MSASAAAPSRLQWNGKMFHESSARCHRRGCSSMAACFGFPGEDSVSCGKHRWSGMVSLDTYVGPGCSTGSSSSSSGAGLKMPANVDTYVAGAGKVRKRPARAVAEEPRRARVGGGYGGCGKERTAPAYTQDAAFGHESFTARRRERERCGAHKLPGMVDLAVVGGSARAGGGSATSSSSRRARTRVRGRGGSRGGSGSGSGSGNGSGSSDGAAEGDGVWEEGGDGSDYLEEEEEVEEEQVQEKREVEEKAATGRPPESGCGSSRRRPGERCTASGCDETAAFGLPGEAPARTFWSGHHQRGMSDLKTSYRDPPKPYLSKRKRKRELWFEEEEEEEEEETGVGGGTGSDRPEETAARDARPHAPKRPREAAGHGAAAVTAGRAGSASISGVGGGAAGGGVGAACRTSEIDAIGVGFRDATASQQEDGWAAAAVGGGSGDEADGRVWRVTIGVSDEACFKVSEDAAELWCHQDTSPVVLEAPTKAQVSMVIEVKHEMGAIAVVNQEAAEAARGWQQPTLAGQSVLGMDHPGGGKVAGTVDVKPELTAGKNWKDWKNNCRGRSASEWARTGGDGEPRWEWIQAAAPWAVDECVDDGGGHELKRDARYSYGGCQPRIGVY